MFEHVFQSVEGFVSNAQRELSSINLEAAAADAGRFFEHAANEIHNAGSHVNLEQAGKDAEHSVGNAVAEVSKAQSQVNLEQVGGDVHRFVENVGRDAGNVILSDDWAHLSAGAQHFFIERGATIGDAVGAIKWEVVPVNVIGWMMQHPQQTIFRVSKRQETAGKLLSLLKFSPHTPSADRLTRYALRLSAGDTNTNEGFEPRWMDQSPCKFSFNKRGSTKTACDLTFPLKRQIRRHCFFLFFFSDSSCHWPYVYQDRRLLASVKQYSVSKQGFIYATRSRFGRSFVCTERLGCRSLCEVSKLLISGAHRNVRKYKATLSLLLPSTFYSCFNHAPPSLLRSWNQFVAGPTGVYTCEWYFDQASM